MGSGFVVMAVYRPNPRLLERQLSSLRAQTITDWRCLIGIDGADPETHRLVESLVGGDHRFDVCTYPENVGVYRHFERLLREVPPDVAWVALADQDDYWYPTKFQHLTSALSASAVLAVSGQARLVDAVGRDLGRTHRRSGDVTALLLRNQITGSLTVFGRSVLELALPFPEGNEMAIHDHWLAVCAALLGSVIVLPNVVQEYVQHAGNALGERPPTRVRDHVRSALSGLGPRSYSEHFARIRWGWRVSMATALRTRQPLSDHERRLDCFADGGPSIRLLAVVLSCVLNAQLRPTAGIGALVSAWWWQRLPRVE